MPNVVTLRTNWNNLAGKPSTFPPSPHSTNHKSGGSDEVASVTPGANLIPKANGTGILNPGYLGSGGSGLGTKILFDDSVWRATTNIVKQLQATKVAILSPAAGTEEWVEAFTVSSSLNQSNIIMAAINYAIGATAPTDLSKFTYSFIQTAASVRSAGVVRPQGFLWRVDSVSGTTVNLRFNKIGDAVNVDSITFSVLLRIWTL